MANCTSDINSRTTTLVQSLSDSCQRQFSALDSRVSKIEMSASASQSEQAVVNAEFRAEIDDVRRQLAVDSVQSPSIDPAYESALNFAFLQLNSDIYLSISDYKHAITQWLSPKYTAE
eukprot:6560274-Karenia_brevis.AAC.1